MVNNIEMRQVFTDTLLNLMEKDKSIVVCDADLSSSSGERELFKKFPDRTINFGISEANMAAAAGGLSLVGFKPIIHSFAPFVTRRIMDQIYVSLGFSANNCLIYGSDPGYWSKYNGPTHTTFEDIAVMTSIPRMTVVSPCDAAEWQWILEYYSKYGGLIYVRAPRQKVESIYPSDYPFSFGKGIEIKKGKDLAIFTCGPEICDVKELAEEYKKANIDIGIYDLLFLKPLDVSLIQNVISSYPRIISVENHNVIGGISQQIAYQIAIAEGYTKPLFRSVAVKDRYSEVGTVEYLKEVLKIDKDSIKNTVDSLLKE